MKSNKDDTTITITRKYAIIPISSETKEWNKRIYAFTADKLNKKITSLTEDIEEINDKPEKKKTDEDRKHLEELNKSLSDANNILEEITRTKEYTQKMINDYTYSLVRTAMEEEARRKNYILSWMFSEMTEHGVQYMETLKKKQKFVKDTINYAYRKKGSKAGSLFDNTEITNILNGYGTAFKQAFTGKINDAVKDGLLEGKVSLPSYKMDSPFTLEKATMGFTHDYENYEELCEHINDKDLKLYFDYGGNQKPTIARFKINLGHGKNKDELKATLLKLYSGEYQYCGSSIQISKNKIILNLSMKIPKKEMDLDENVVVGVDLGMAVPAMCALNNSIYEKQPIGSADDFLAIRTRLQAQRRKLQIALKSTAGGHGRKKKLKALNRLRDREKHFVESYCHFVSKQVVDFALKHRAKYINIENLVGYNTSKFILRNWSYYKLQQYITYKATRYGIIVRKINPCYTSQVCSYCGHWEPKQRKSQDTFICGSEDCISNNKKKVKYTVNADFNAARNIAMSTLFMETGEVTEKTKEKAREYYGFEEEYQKYKAKNEEAKENKEEELYDLAA